LFAAETKFVAVCFAVCVAVTDLCCTRPVTPVLSACCIVLQCVAARCGMLQCGAVRCSRQVTLNLSVSQQCVGEGTGTWPDYLVNCNDQKNEGPFGEKNSRKSRNSCRLNGQGCACIGTVDSRRNFAQF